MVLQENFLSAVFFFCFLVYSVLSRAIMVLGFIFEKMFLRVSILVTVLLVTRTTTIQVNTTMCTSSPPFITLHEHLQVI